jgi:beta-glucosidase
VVLALGDNEQTSREAWALNHLGDRASLDLVGLQDELVDALAATGKPVIAVLFQPTIAIRNLTAKAAALQCWYLGRRPAEARRSPSATSTPAASFHGIPRSVGHIPATTSPPPGADICSTT